MAFVEINKEWKSEELEEGKIFDEDELIVSRLEEEMVTLRREYISGDCIRRYHYDLSEKNGRVMVNNNCYAEFYPDNFEYEEYNENLRWAKL